MAALDSEALKLCSNLPKTDSTKWVPLSLTLVEYPEGDWLGKILALISLTPFAIIFGFLSLILFRRDLHTISFFFGTIVNEIFNFILKHWFCEPRPLQRNVLYSEYGMPSSHSQFMWFFATYVTCFVCIRLHHMNNNSILETVWKSVIISSVTGLASLVTISRVYLEYHSFGQVLCGFLVGVFLGGAWFALVYIVLTPLFPIVTSWRVSEFLMLRDSTLIPNVLWFEYTNIRQESRARSRKLISMKSQ